MRSRSPAVLWALVLSVALVACGDSDEGPDAAVVDGAPIQPDASLIDAVADGATVDALTDATVDALTDATVDAPVDAAVDAPTDATIDAPTDATIDAPIDAPIDARPDASFDARVDAALPVDAALDAAPPDAGVGCRTDFPLDQIHVGDYTVSTALDLQIISGKRLITGTLRILTSTLTSVALPNLEYVGGDLYLISYGVQNVDLPVLCHAGALSVTAGMTTLSLPALREIDRDVSLAATTLTSASFPVLGAVPRYFTITSPLQTLGAPALQTIGRLALGASSGPFPMTDLRAFTALRSLRALSIQEATNLRNLAGLEGVTALPGGLIIGESNRLDSLDGLGLTAGPIGGIDLVNVRDLSDLSALEPVTSVVVNQIVPGQPSSTPSSGDVRIQGCKELHDTGALGSIRTVANDVYIPNNTELASITFAALETAGTLRIGVGHPTNSHPALTSVSFPSLRTLTQRPDSAATFEISGTPVLTSIAFPILSTVNGSARFANAPLLPTCQPLLLRTQVTIPGNATWTVTGLGNGICP